MQATGSVSIWRGEEGWGVIDSAETPGGCWFHFSTLWHVELPAMGDGETITGKGGYRTVDVGEHVRFEYEEAEQSGFRFRADSVWPLNRWSPPMQFRLSR